MWDELEDTLKINEKTEEIILNKETRRLIKKGSENIFKYYSLQGPKRRIV